MRTLSYLFFLAAINGLVACSKDSSSATTATATQYASGGVCTNTSGQQVACNETVAANSGSQVVPAGSTITNAAQVPDSTVLPASVSTATTASVSNSQVDAKTAEIRADAVRITNDPESATDASAALGTASVNSSVPVNTVSYETASVAQTASVQRIPATSAQPASAAVIPEVSDSAYESSGGQAVR